MRGTFKLLPLLLVTSLTACANEANNAKRFYCFGTVVTTKINAKDNTPFKEVKKICNRIDALADSYYKRDVFGVYDLNLTNEKVEISEELYDLFYWAKKVQEDAPYYNPLMGSLSQKWKDSLANNQVLSDSVIQEELNKVNASSLEIENSGTAFYAQRVGNAQIDLGAIAKGYALYQCQNYLEDEYFTEDYGDFIINAGNSSVLLGNYQGKDRDYYLVMISDLSAPSYLHLNKCVISTSSVSEQGVKIGDKTYSHIINPVTGSAINNYDAVIVINDQEAYGNAALGDALSTSLMMSSLEEIAQTENDLGVGIIAIKDDAVVYKSESIEIHNG